MIGSDGATGTAVVLSKDHAVGTLAIVRTAGMAWRIDADELVPLLQRRRGLHVELLRHVHAFLGQMAETAVAIGHDHTDQRLARWLLQASDRLGTTRVAVTHQQLSQALGVRRSGATVALHLLESQDLIRSRRKLVEILDREGLARAAGGL